MADVRIGLDRSSAYRFTFSTKYRCHLDLEAAVRRHPSEFLDAVDRCRDEPRYDERDVIPEFLCALFIEGDRDPTYQNEIGYFEVEATDDEPRFPDDEPGALERLTAAAESIPVVHPDQMTIEDVIA